MEKKIQVPVCSYHHVVTFVVIVHCEVAKSPLKGTIIDIETLGEFCREYGDCDSRQYQNFVPMIFGYIDKNRLKIYCAKSNKLPEKLKTTIAEVLPDLARPLYAFNCNFERGVLFHSYRIILNFDGELTKEKFESKRNAVASLSIDNYDDPFHDDGRKCKVALEKGNMEPAIRHNRSCLLKERDILLKRGHRTPEDLSFSRTASDF